VSAPLAAALLLVLLLGAFVSACGGPSPSDTVIGVIEAYNRFDFNAVYDASSQKLKQASGGRKKAVDQLAISFPPGAQIVDYAITSEETDGDRATVTWTGTLRAPDLPDQEIDTKVNLVKEDGQWKMDQQSSGAGGAASPAPGDAGTGGQVTEPLPPPGPPRAPHPDTGAVVVIDRSDMTRHIQSPTHPPVE
jgi:hypothetical protein